jgi:hypothetical protein
LDKLTDYAPAFPDTYHS